MKRNKQILAAAVSVAVAAGTLAGCGTGGGSGSQSNKLKYWVPFYSHYQQQYTNYSEVPFYQELQKRTDTELEFIHPTVGQEAEGFSLMVASGDLPDIIEYSIGKYKGGAEKAISDNVIIDLTDVIEQKAPNLNQVLNEHEDWKRLVRTDSGQYYCFPAIRGDVSLTYWRGPQMRQDFLDEVHMDRPETIDEWEKVLTAFRDQLKIQYPLSFINADHAQTVFASPYGVTGSNTFYLDNGKVKYGPLEKGYEEYLKLMNRWIEAGLLDPDFATHDSKTFDAKVSSGKTGAYLNSVGGGMGTYIKTTKQNNPNAKLTAVKFPVLNKGEEPRMGFYQFPFVDAQSAQITRECKNVDAAVRLLDYAYSDEGHMFFNFGTEGESYTMENGTPTYTEAITANPEGLSMQNAMSRYCKAAVVAPMIQDPRYYEQYMQMPEQKETTKIWKLSDTSWAMPPVTLTTAETGKVSSKQTEITTYVNEMSLKFIMGAEPMENLDSFRQTVKNMGIDEVVSVQQAAYDRYLKR